MAKWELVDWANLHGEGWTISGFPDLHCNEPRDNHWRMIIPGIMYGKDIESMPLVGVGVMFKQPTTVFDDTTATISIGRELHECSVSFACDPEDNDAMYLNIWKESKEVSINIQLSRGTLLNVPLYASFWEEEQCYAKDRGVRTLPLAELVKKLPRWDDYEYVGIAPRSGYWDGPFDIIIYRNDRFYKAQMITERTRDGRRMRVVLEIPDSEMDKVEASDIQHSRNTPIRDSEKWKSHCGKRHGVTAWKEVAWIL